jgi:hypothetical protein
MLGSGGMLLGPAGTPYKTLAAAEAAGAVHQGWIPGWLPKNAFNLRERHDLRTGSSILRFNFPAGQTFQLSSDCTPVPHSQVREPGMQATWWPTGLSALSETSARYTYYACASGVFLAWIRPAEKVFIGGPSCTSPLPLRNLLSPC